MKILNPYGLTILTFNFKCEDKIYNSVKFSWSMLWILFKYLLKKGQIKVQLRYKDKENYIVDFVFYRYIKLKDNKSFTKSFVNY